MENERYRIITYGLKQEEIDLVKKNIPKKEYEVLEYDTVSDLIGHCAAIYIICADVLDEDEKMFFFSFYEEIDGCTDETVFWLGNVELPNYLKKDFMCFDSFAEFQNDLKYSLLTAHTKSKKAREFSVKLADCIKILSMIRNKPGIKTQELVEQLEKSNRTVQRYIETLRMAGEWIVYDSKKKGWYLEYGTSQLFEVYFERGE